MNTQQRYKDFEDTGFTIEGTTHYQYRLLGHLHAKIIVITASVTTNVSTTQPLTAPLTSPSEYSLYTNCLGTSRVHLPNVLVAYYGLVVAVASSGACFVTPVAAEPTA
ncbi:uncharacterized protein ATNIH1004_010677 [Aspergillus tanneri]|uniref:Uncharacterized protein n=1 Tax=Aspergillus tanneri TaxID=1220188 RepID=A0A5M9M4P5_9EURO|nr:uncharacterized protein ATNIH1004_010677 [Aspergillus tanneri]KAA8641738.1 hypothetical protein ATNIH1004_010677 [Aspergillus tanneri]